ncbi:uncharacterized protein LOC143453357 isoform X1 [Clavelina lepadiformis]|uniref:uncharacterized protein LOC143453357 isoform X1 n=1 Tax=Clavelina lepadiformis TaxID=159417 RepID=UPI0040423636
MGNIISPCCKVSPLNNVAVSPETHQIKFYKSKEILCITDDDEGYLGAGSCGKVRLGFHEKFGAVARKCIEMQAGRLKRYFFEKKIKQEIGHLQKANHENIVRVYGWTHWPGAVAIIMEYLPAGNLKAILMDENVVLGPLLRARFGEEIANGLAFIHNVFDNKRLLHGDIKPENILMTEDLHCKIGDFGIAQLSNYTGSTASADDVDSEFNLQTVLYAAPERLQDSSTKLTPKYDTYSYGMTLYIILAREIPIDTGTPVQTIIDMIIEGKRPGLHSIENHIKKLETDGQSDDAAIIRFLKDEMNLCLHQDPSNRPTMTEVRDRLGSQLQNRDLSVLQKQVDDALEDLSFKYASFDEEKCVSIDQFLPPTFQFNAWIASFGNNISALSVLKFFIEGNVVGASHTSLPDEDKGEEVEEEPQPDETNREESDEDTNQVDRSLIEDGLRYLRTCGLLEDNWKPDVAERAKKIFKKFARNFSSYFIEEFRKEAEGYKLLCDNFVPLFAQYFKLLTDDGNGYPRDSVPKLKLLKSVKLAIWNITDYSLEFCIESGKQGLLTLIVAHLQHVQSLLGLASEEKLYAEESCVNILHNCARKPECLEYVKNTNVVGMMSSYKNELFKKATIQLDSSRVEFLTYCAFLMAYVLDESEVQLLKIHETLISYIVTSLKEALQQNDHICSGGGSLEELCSGLAQLARSRDISSDILKTSKSMKFIVSTLESENASEREAGLHLLHNLCLSKQNKKKLKQQKHFIDCLDKMRTSEPIETLMKLADEIHQKFSS